jgi:hypothetical protein
MSREPELQGERVNSKNTTPMRKPVARVASGINKAIAEAIPFWPKVISSLELASNVGLSVTAVVSRIAGVQEEYKVFQHKRGFSRIKPDYTNMEQKGKDSWAPIP